MNRDYPRGTGSRVFGFSRKDRLTKRAFKIAEAVERHFAEEFNGGVVNASVVNDKAHAWMDGYRAAIAELRKEVNKADTKAGPHGASTHAINRIVREFLRPLR